MEETLLRRIVARDKEALSLLYDRYARTLFNIIVKSVDEEERVEEIIKDIFKEIWQHPEEYIKENHFSVSIIKLCNQKVNQVLSEKLVVDCC